jgi:hypothetical protein
MRVDERLLEYTSAFASGLLNPDVTAPVEVLANADSGLADRYNVYRNNVTVSLIDALAAIYPAVQRITGVEFFRAMARFHMRATPPSSPLLFEYGRDFPTFIEGYAYAQEIPWLADIARIERAWMDAYHAADLPVLPAEALASIEEAALPDVRFVAHPAVSVVRSIYPAVAIFAMNRTEDALITRPAQEVIVSRLPPGGATFLTCLIEGASLGESVGTAFEECPSFDLPANLAGMVSAGVFTAIQDGE